MATNLDLLYYSKIEKRFNELMKLYEDYNVEHEVDGELIDICYHYMSSYIHGYSPGICMFLDEFENCTGERSHQAVLEVIDWLEQ